MTSGEATPPALDGAISLVDNTEPSETVQEPSRHTSVSSPSIITKRLTSSVREELTRRKYAKWQPERLGVRDGEGPGHGRSQSKDQDLLSRGPSRTSAVTGSSEAFNEAIDRQAGNLEALNTIPTQLQTDEDAVQHPRVASELDILYENQRGWFFCGLPFYSHRSLLQIDPPAWVNRDYKPSSVDVTNAQVPDPSWHWLWRSWYVDMSGDVDEEGWQYSFSFGGKFGWHGTHPWFHSYVRRRRWVRLRAKTKSSLARSGERGMGPAHRLNEDYFTIHTRNVPGSRDPSIDMYPDNATGPVSRSSRALPPEQILHEDIEDIPTLMQALRLSMVDRERVEVVKNFLAHGGEELYYLEEKACYFFTLGCLKDFILTITCTDTRNYVILRFSHHTLAVSKDFGN